MHSQDFQLLANNKTAQLLIHELNYVIGHDSALGANYSQMWGWHEGVREGHLGKIIDWLQRA